MASVRFALVLVVAAALTSCRQADGMMPTPNQTAEEDIYDLSRDLQNVAGGNPDAPGELAQDIHEYALDKAAARPAVEELVKRTTGTLGGRMLSEQTARQLAHSLWMTVAARDLSERQIEALQNDVRTIVMSTGVSEEGAQQLAAQVGVVQLAVTDRQRRWYEMF
jgi:hypothetical protein